VGDTSRYELGLARPLDENPGVHPLAVAASKEPNDSETGFFICAGFTPDLC